MYLSLAHNQRALSMNGRMHLRGGRHEKIYNVRRFQWYSSTAEGLVHDDIATPRYHYLYNCLCTTVQHDAPVVRCINSSHHKVKWPLFIR